MVDIKGDNVRVYGFMVQDLELVGSELIIYALVYSYHEQEMEMILNLEELSIWTGISIPQVQGVLWQLEERCLIVINERELEGDEIYTLGIL